MDIEKFLKQMGMKDQQPTTGQWDRVIQPNSSYLIIGDVGTGKSALAHHLLETYSEKYNLLPAVVGLPREKQGLLPSNFIIKDSPSECTKLENAIVLIDEADLQLPIEDAKARQYVVNFLSLPRHRHQIFLLAFHFPRLVLGRYLPFFSAFLLKRPPYLIEFAGKRQNDALTEMMRRAEERFAELPSEADIIKHTYVVAPRIRWQGMLENPLPLFWTHELSEVWAGTEIEEQKPPQKQMSLPSIELLPIKGVTKGWHADDPEKKLEHDVSPEMIRRGKQVEEHFFQNRGWIVKEDPVTRIRWLEEAY